MTLTPEFEKRGRSPINFSALHATLRRSAAEARATLADLVAPEFSRPDREDQEESSRDQAEQPTMSARELLSSYLSLLNQIGISNTKIIGLNLIGALSTVLQWGAIYFFVERVAAGVLNHNPSYAFGSVLLAGGCFYSYFRLERLWRVHVDEDRFKLERELTKRLLRIHADSSLHDLYNPKLYAEKELCSFRIGELKGSLEYAYGIVNQIAPILMTVGYAFFQAGPLIAILIVGVVAAGLLPIIRTIGRQVRQDVALEQAQSGEESRIGKILEQAYDQLGSLKMIAGDRAKAVEQVIDGAMQKLEQQSASLSHRQILEFRLPDLAFSTAVVVGGAGLLAGHFWLAQPGSLSSLMFLLTTLINCFTDGESLGGELERVRKIRRDMGLFFGFLKPSAPTGTERLPESGSLHFATPSFQISSDDDTFTVSLPYMTLNPGDLLIVHGVSGAGKTTILNHLALNARCAAGRVELNRVPMHDIALTELRGAIGFCQALPSLDLGFSVLEVFQLNDPKGLYLADRLDHPMISQLIKDLQRSPNGLNTRIGAEFENGRAFSLGERKRIELVTALVPTPRLLVLDEVSANQGEPFIRTLTQAIQGARRDQAIVIFATHSAAFDLIASHILNVNRGTAELVRSPENLASHLRVVSDPDSVAGSNQATA